MKPLKLTMQAFANYAQKQVIDFTELEGKNMFLITGKTGAGKTTVFDAISYALFGKASGDARGSDSLRSDYADGSLETVVELEFELRGEVYKVTRKPAQKLNKKRGEGLTMVSAEANLYLPNVERPITRIGAVDEGIVDILGVTSEQFKQIVMLPQGEFIKFLRASSGEREIIFRRIFGTEKFNKIQTGLTEKAKNLESELKFELNSRSVFVKKIKADEGSVLASKLADTDLDIETVLELTKDLIKIDLNQAEILQKENDINKDNIKKSEDTERILKSNKSTISSYEEAKKLFEEKNSLKNTVDEWRVKLENGRKATSIKVVEDSYKEGVKRFNDSDKNLKESEAEKVEISNKLESAKINLEKEKLRDGEKQKFIFLTQI